MAGGCNTREAGKIIAVVPICNQSWRQEFSDKGLAPPTKGLKYGF